MKRLLLAAVLMFPVLAYAQVPPTKWSQNYIPTLTDWKSALTYQGQALSTVFDGINLNLSGKVSTDGGELDSGTLSKGTTITGSGDLSFIPKGSPLTGSVGSVVVTLGLNHPGVQNFGHNTECTSSSVAPSAGGNVCQYVWTELTSSSGGAWSQSLVTQMDSGFKAASYSSLVTELDMNNLAGDYGEFSTANSIGILLNGLGYMNTSAVSVQTGNSSSGTSGTNGQIPIWYYGVHFGSSAVLEADVDTQSSAVYGWRGRGSHVFAASYADDNTTSAAIQLGNNGPQQGIVGRNGTTNYSMLYMSTDGSVHVGNLAQANWQSDGNPLPTTDDTYSLGSSTNRWADIKTLHVNGVPTLTQGTPTIGSACTMGAQYYDGTKLYMCMTDGVMHTLATVAN